MLYLTNIPVILGDTNLILAAQVVDLFGNLVGEPITTGFVEIGGGNYSWPNNFDDSFIGGVYFYAIDDPTNILAFTTINLADGLMTKIVPNNPIEVNIGASNNFGINTGESVTPNQFAIKTGVS